MRLWEQIEILHKDTVISAELAVEGKIILLSAQKGKKEFLLIISLHSLRKLGI